MTARCAFAMNPSARVPLLDIDLPWLGSVFLTWRDETRGRRFFDHGYDLHDRSPGEHLFWLGRLHLAFYRNASLWPSRATWLALALIAVNVAGWTEGHVWRW